MDFVNYNTSTITNDVRTILQIYFIYFIIKYILLSSILLMFYVIKTQPYVFLPETNNISPMTSFNIILTFA